MKHLDWFCVEMIRNELITNMIPNLMKEVEEDNETDSVVYELLKDYVIQPPSYSSVLRWLHTMGFTSYSNKRQSYMVDGHEHPAQRAHQKKVYNRVTNGIRTTLPPLGSDAKV